MKKPAKKVQRRRHARPRIAPIDEAAQPALLADRNEALVSFNAEFCRDLPQHAGTGQHAKDGNYTQVEGDKFDGKNYPIPDGRYRVAGSDWVFDFEGGGFVEAMRATKANEFGGPSTINVSLS